MKWVQPRVPYQTSTKARPVAVVRLLRQAIPKKARKMTSAYKWKIAHAQVQASKMLASGTKVPSWYLTDTKQR